MLARFMPLLRLRRRLSYVLERARKFHIPRFRVWDRVKRRITYVSRRVVEAGRRFAKTIVALEKAKIELWKKVGEKVKTGISTIGAKIKEVGAKITEFLPKLGAILGKIVKYLPIILLVAVGLFIALKLGGALLARRAIAYYPVVRGVYP